MKSVRHWRLWHRLFGWDYAQVWDHKKEDAFILRVFRLPDGRRAIHWRQKNKARCVYPLDDCKHVLPLTWTSENDTFRAFAELVQKQLSEE